MANCVTCKARCVNAGQHRVKTDCISHIPKNDLKPMTNYDFFISKTPEELAKTIVEWLADVAELYGENRQEFDFTNAEEYAISWLKSPMEE